MRPSGPAFAAAEVAAAAAAAVEEEVAVVGAMGRYISRAGCPLLFPFSLFSPFSLLSLAHHTRNYRSLRPVALLYLLFDTFFFVEVAPLVTIRRAPSNATTTTLGGV
jgi:hypothetical protein